MTQPAKADEPMILLSAPLHKGNVLLHLGEGLGVWVGVPTEAQLVAVAPKLLSKPLLLWYKAVLRNPY